ncbi:amidohydrolase [Saxibacter everestensis]|uniref:Amidohydrolase n=1 Tax=Saxibacter everestensis TaxID=2909229 RepID=A0ABY8QQC5_9MICO|nr:amidohydrolase [Brevibacteriaceae bacterium ZFBP1038]
MTGADWIFHGGPVLTMDSEAPTTDAVAVADGRIVAVGASKVAEVKASHTEIVDLRGSALLPGFQDAHIHPVAGGLQQLQCDLSEWHSLDDYRQVIRRYAAHAAGEWIQGAGWYGDVFEGGFPDRLELDALVGDRPAVFVSHDAHGAWVNSAALRRAGITSTTPDPAGGRIFRDHAGQPTGMLAESAAELVTRLIPPPEGNDLEKALLSAQSYLHSLGITAWQDAAVGEALGIPETFPLYCDLDDRAQLTARVTAALWWDRDAGLEQIPELAARRKAAGHRRFQATAIKIMQDGVCENLTAAVLHAYRGQPGNHGMSFIEPAALTEIVGRLDRERFDIHLHAVGDRAVRECLDAIEASASREWDSRHQIAHIDLIDRSDVLRMRQLNVIANIQPLWARQDPVLVETKLPYLDDAQRSQHFAFRALADAGVALAMGSDWPVSSPDPIWGIHVAVNRTAPVADPHAADERSQTEPLLPGEAISVQSALHAYTLGAARANRLDHLTGSIEIGKAADLVVLDRDPLHTPARELSAIRPRLTMVGGQVVHESAGE